MLCIPLRCWRPGSVFEERNVVILGRRNEQNARTGTVDVKGAIKVHHLVLRASGGDGLLDLGPFSDKVSERL